YYSHVDTVLFNADVDPSDVQVVHGNSWDITLALSDGSTLAIVDQFGRFDQIQEFQFQDAAHTLWTEADIYKKAIQYETANGHTIYDTPGDNTLDPGQGTGFYLSGGFGYDTFVFGEGYGHDTISPNGGGPGDTLLFNPGVDPSAVHFARGANPLDLVITLADGSEVDVLDQFGSGYFGDRDRLAGYQFQDANHTLLTSYDIENQIFATEEATPGAVVHGFQAGQTLDG